MEHSIIFASQVGAFSCQLSVVEASLTPSLCIYLDLHVSIDKGALSSSVLQSPLNQDGLFIQDAATARPEVVPLPSCVRNWTLEYLRTLRHQASSASSSVSGTARFLIPAQDGYVTRSDFLDRRLASYRAVERVASFLQPLQRVIAVSHNQEGTRSLSSLLQHAIGALFILHAEGDVSRTKDLQLLDEALTDRLSFPWLSSTPISPKRIAWVEGRKDVEVSERMYDAAAALGITLVVIDKSDHWLEDEGSSNARFREAFVPVDISVDSGFVDRIVAAVRAYPRPIHGIMTVSDSRLIGVARACEILGFPTSPVEAYVLAADKYKTRMLEDDNGECFQVSSTAQLDQHLSMCSTPLAYPLICKPTLGWGSEAVTRVSSERELRAAVAKASDRHKNSPQQSTTVVVEPYISGPEIDANFVLLDGEVVFFECCDDFPCTADNGSSSSATTGSPSNFLETQMMFPSALPETGLLAARDTIHRSILQQGFRTGTFHCEARMRNSSTEYSVSDDGTLDLQPRTQDRGNNDGEGSNDDAPSTTTVGAALGVWLIEINARPAGYMATSIAHRTYGVDYFALQLLFAADDHIRFAALAHPFHSPPRESTLVQFVPQTSEGMMKTADAGRELLRREPELAAYVVDYKTWVKGGEMLLGERHSELNWLAHFSIVGVDRRACLGRGREVLTKIEYEIE